MAPLLSVTFFGGDSTVVVEAYLTLFALVIQHEEKKKDENESEFSSVFNKTSSGYDGKGTVKVYKGKRHNGDNERGRGYNWKPEMRE